MNVVLLSDFWGRFLLNSTKLNEDELHTGRCFDAIYHRQLMSNYLINPFLIGTGNEIILEKYLGILCGLLKILYADIHSDIDDIGRYLVQTIRTISHKKANHKNIFLPSSSSSSSSCCWSSATFCIDMSWRIFTSVFWLFLWLPWWRLIINGRIQ